MGACDTYFLQKNKVLKEYCSTFPERIPPADAGRPLLPIIVEFFCGELWANLIEAASDDAHRNASIDSKIHWIFEKFDADHNGKLSLQELQSKCQQLLGTRLSSKIIVEQMPQLVDTDLDGQISELELRE